MYRNKKDVDKHVENLLSKLSVKEFNTRAYSVARLYFDVSDFSNCQKYVAQYLTQKDNNAAAYKLLGQVLQRLGQKEKALEQYKTSLDIDPTQTNTVLDICEILADEDVTVDPGQGKFWCEKAEATFPTHPVTFRLREKLVMISNPDPEAFVNLLTSELIIRPKDLMLHIRLLKHYLHVNKLREAYEHSCNIEFINNYFLDNYAWYEILVELLKVNIHNADDWQYQLFNLTVRERICMLSLTEIPGGSSKSLIESNELLHIYDQAIEAVAKAGPSLGFAEFHAVLLQHHRGQFAIHAATFLLKKAKKSQLNWRDALKLAAPLMLIAWHTTPLDPKVHWLRHAPEMQINAVKHWYSEGTYRCSQSGHYLLTNVQDKNQSFLDQISQSCSDTHWRDKLYEKIFPNKIHLAKIKTSHFISNLTSSPVLRLPRKNEIETYDCEAQRGFGSSLHHFVWTLLNYKNLAHFKCTLFDMLTPSVTVCGPEALSKLDILAFLYCATLTCKQQKIVDISHFASDKPIILPANITDTLCSLPQLKWWDCAYKFSQNRLGTELTDIRATLTRGVEVIRCIDNHGLDAELLCILGRIFSENSNNIINIDEKNHMELRAALYYSSAIPILEKLKSKIVVKIPEKRMFDYTHKDLSSKDISSLIEESKLYIASRYFNDSEYDKVVEILSNLKSPQAFFYLSKTYKNLALEENSISKYDIPETFLKYTTMLSKAKLYGYKALDRLKEAEANKTHPLFKEIRELIDDIEMNINKIDPDTSASNINDREGKYSSDDNISINNMPIKINRRNLRNLSSTPKAASNTNITSYQTAVDAQVLESTQVDQQFFERIENEIKTLHNRDSTINEFMNQTRNWFDENRKLGNQIMSTINTNMENTTDQFKLLKISIDNVKDQIEECKNECKDVGELKKQIAELRKEVNKLKKSESGPAVDGNNLYNLDHDYRTNDTTATLSSQLPFASPHVLPSFNQRLAQPFPVQPNPYQLYGGPLYNLYNQYSQFSQATSTPGATPMYDPTRTQVNYPNVYPTPDQFYLDMTHLMSSNPSVVPTVSSTPVVPTITSVPPMPVLPKMPVVSVAPTSVITSKVITKDKDISRSLPVNVVITSSDPLPTTTTVVPTPVLSVTIPSKHIKGTPHNYQIPMPSTNETKPVVPPIFSFSLNANKSNTATATTVTSSPHTWTPSSIQTSFKPHQSITETSTTSRDSSFNTSLNNSKSVVDGICQPSPNTSVNKSRTFSEKSNTSVENYDPCPDYKPIVPLPAEVKVKTGEEDETVIFCARAKLFRFVDKQWKERGLGEMKLLKHKITGKVRVLMRREQIYKICANHIISPEMEIKPMLNETKAYFWVAHDYADENMVLEKFCIRFKTADIALEFYNTFEKSRQESSATTSDKITAMSETDAIHSPEKDNIKIISTLGKAVVGGFTFSSTPNFKTVSNSNEIDRKFTDQNNDKTNIFSGFAFKTNTNSPFSNLFNTPSADTSSGPSSTANKQVSNKLNVSDTVEEYEPNADFKPVVPLPALIDQKTGEEDEVVLFEHRAKLLRFVAATKEWKERGLGNIKLLVQKDNINKVRLVMRREQIMKVCCNHAVTKEMIFQKMPNIDKAVTWCAQDFTDGELIAETFCLRFKTLQICNDFVDAVKTAQSRMKHELKAAKEEQNIQTMNESTITGWGDKFKPKSGSWECQYCLIRNEAIVQNCSACNNPKEVTLTSLDNKTAADKNSFKLGVPIQTLNSAELVTSTWGDKFKSKEGTWECNACFVRNESNLENCIACNNPKDTNKKENKSIFDSNVCTVKFRFGYPPVASNYPNTNTETSSSSIFDGTGTHKFSFGIHKTTSDNLQPLIEDQTKIQSNVNSESIGPINFCLKSNKESVKTNVQAKTPLLPTPQTNIVTKPPVAKDCASFGFVFKPKTSLIEHEKESKPLNENIDSNTGTNEDDTCISTTSTSSMVSTIEESETTLYCQTASLLRFIDGEWKKRGFGYVKILKHNESENVRVVMRNEETSKVCLNHKLTPEITYTPKDDRSWLFASNDYSEGESSLQQLCLKFNNKDVALQFKQIIDRAREGKLDNEDVIFVSETHATTEEQEKAKDLMLPKNFFTYKNKDPCQGCRGCENEDEPSNIVVKPAAAETTLITLSTPAKSTVLSFHSPASSLYGTPTTSEKTFDTTIFRTPLSSIDSATKAMTVLTKPANVNVFNKENSCQQNSTDVIGSSEQNSSFQIQTEFPSLFAHGDTKHPTVTKSSVLAPSKLSTPNVVMGETTGINPILNSSGFGDMKSMFGNSGLGTSSNKSIFDTSTTRKEGEVQSIFGSTNQREVQSIFGGDKYASNLFSAATQGKLFGSQTGSVNDVKQAPGQYVFSSQKLLFGNTLNQQSSQSLEPSHVGLMSDMDAVNKYNQDKRDVKKDIVLGFDRNLSFSDLSSSVNEPSFEKKSDFQWEGAGQQLFVSKQKLNKFKKESDKSDEASGAGDDYDPHYEPVVPLPDKVVTTTGEEDEEKLFGERCKLYRYEDKTREWKERGVGEIKILYHPEKKTYRLLLRREQIYKCVLNMLLFIDFEMLPMMKSDRAWTWAGINYPDGLSSGEQETLAVRFKSTELATRFHQQVVSAVKSLQALAAIGDEKKSADEKQFESVPLLRLPKNMDDSSRADAIIVTKADLGIQSPAAVEAAESRALEVQDKTDNSTKANGNVTITPAGDTFKQVQFQVPEEEEQEQPEVDEYEYEQNEYDTYYNEEEEDEDESSAYYSCNGEAVIMQGEIVTKCEHAHIIVTFDQDIHSPKILVEDAATGEILTDMLIHTETEFQMTGDSSCTWSGRDYTSNDAVNKTVTINFFDGETAMCFYDSCETSKAASYSSMDPES